MSVFIIVYFFPLCQWNILVYAFIFASVKVLLVSVLCSYVSDCQCQLILLQGCKHCSLLFGSVWQRWIIFGQTFLMLYSVQ